MRYTVSLLALLVLTGCTSTRVADLGAPTTHAAINEKAQRQITHMRLTDGRTMQVTYLRLDADSASYIDGKGDVRSIAADQIASVRFTRHGQGALQGLGVGVLAGGGGGALIGLISSTTCREDDWFCGPGVNAAVFGTLLGAIGGMVGLGLGFSRGRRTVYRFDDDQVAPSPRTTPTTRSAPESPGGRSPQ